MSQRFTDAELAAEYWAAYSDQIRNSAQIAYEKGALDNPHIMAGYKTDHERMLTIYRFATLPHANQETHYCECGHLDVHHYGQVGHCLDNYNPMRGCACQTFK